MAVYTEEHRQRVMAWYAPARIGLFYHWGLFTGGGCSGPPDWSPAWNQPFTYPTVEAFEAAAADPDAIARNMVDTAVHVGARYIIYTAFHCSEHYCPMYPSAVEGFLVRTTKDYLGAFIRECVRQEIKPILYFPSGSGNWVRCGDGVWLEEPYVEREGYTRLLTNFVNELYQRYGDAIAGFWVDLLDLDASVAELMRRLWPQAIISVNTDTSFRTPEMDICTTEVTTGTLDPAYCRPSALWKVNPWGALPPRRDFNEDIPTCNQWWHGSTFITEEEMLAGPYVQDPTFMVKEMVSSLGQRGQWNYAHGLGPTIDGTPPAMFQPMLDNMHRFMAWAGESIYRTTGGEGAPLQQGWTSGGGFFSITVSLDDPKILYLHVTTAPSLDALHVLHYGQAVREVTDLRTGEQLAFTQVGRLEITGVDWADVTTYGDKVVKVALA
ncbi:MAG: alpha-L-fucosidase [Armatimonadota bacterium]